jgi:orotidine-5'-phosphate decarboxylase
MADLILALDVVKKDEALAVAKACAPYIDAIKIGYPLVLGAGLQVANRLKENNLPLIADFKVADIPNTNTLITEQVFSVGFSAIICQGFVGTDSVKACVDAAHRKGGECYVVAEMSHPGAKEFFHPGTPEQIAANAILAKADGIVAPATRPERVKVLRNIVGSRKILSPGIGAQGGDVYAVAGLVDGVIVGRAIYAADDPAAAARDYARQLGR